MVNRALTSLSLRSFPPMVRAGSPVSSTSMSSIPATRQPSKTAKDAVESRSPFVRLTDLIAGIPPGKEVINLSVGEPQHPVPAFVAPVPAPRRAPPANPPRRVDRKADVWVLNETRGGFFPGAFPPRRWVGPRAGTPA